MESSTNTQVAAPSGTILVPHGTTQEKTIEQIKTHEKYLKHREKILEKQKAYYQTHKEEIKKKRENNPKPTENIKTYNREYYEKNREKYFKPYACECGITLKNLYSKSKHCRTVQHLEKLGLPIPEKQTKKKNNQ